jgi:hypothetical protein
MPRWSKKHFKSVGTTGGITVEHFTKIPGATTIYNRSAQVSLDAPTIRFEAKGSPRDSGRFFVSYNEKGDKL